MEHRLTHENPTREQLTLGELLDAAMAMRDAGAPRDCPVVVLMGDRGGQRDPDPYLRGITVAWGGES